MRYLDLGTFVNGDTGTDVLLSIVQPDGTAFDLTGATAITIEAASAERDTISLIGAIYGLAEDGQMLFEDIAQAFTPTAPRRAATFSGVVRWTQGGEQFYAADGVKFVIARLP